MSLFFLKSSNCGFTRPANGQIFSIDKWYRLCKIYRNYFHRILNFKYCPAKNPHKNYRNLSRPQTPKTTSTTTVTEQQLFQKIEIKKYCFSFNLIHKFYQIYSIFIDITFLFRLYIVPAINTRISPLSLAFFNFTPTKCIVQCFL